MKSIVLIAAVSIMSLVFENEPDKDFVEVKQVDLSNTYSVVTPDGTVKYYLDCKGCPRLLVGYKQCIPDIGKCKTYWRKDYLKQNRAIKK